MDYLDRDKYNPRSTGSVHERNQQDFSSYGLVRGARLNYYGVVKCPRKMQELPMWYNFTQCQAASLDAQDMRAFTREHLLPKSLPPAQSFRLLNLHAGADSDILRGEITTSTLDSHPAYVALSYVWGSESDTLPIATNKGHVVLSKTLAQALKAIRQTGGCTFIWADELCINQKDAAEIATQMLHVGEIFDKAREIYLWHRQTANAVLESSQTFLQRCRLNTHAWRNEPRHQLMELDPFLWCLPEPLGEEDGRSYSVAYTNIPLLNREEFLRCQRTFRNILAACTQEEFQLLADILSAVFSSARPLTLGEMARVTILSRYVDISTQSIDEATKFFAIQGQYHHMRKSQLQGLLRIRWSSILSLDIDEFISPASAYMSTFLNWVQIPGIRKDHGFMAIVCFRELELANAALQCVTTNGHEFSSYCTSLTDFSAYCLDFWQTHYKAAEHIDPSLSARLHSLIWPELMVLKSSDQAGHESVDSECSVYCENCLNWAISYCDRRGFSVLRKTYEQMRDFVVRTNVSRLREQSGCLSFPLAEALDQVLASLRLDEDSKDLYQDRTKIDRLPGNHEHRLSANKDAFENSWIWVSRHLGEPAHECYVSNIAETNLATLADRDEQNVDVAVSDDWQMLNASVVDDFQPIKNNLLNEHENPRGI